jgi:hypothetical protein
MMQEILLLTHKIEYKTRDMMICRAYQLLDQERLLMHEQAIPLEWLFLPK